MTSPRKISRQQVRDEPYIIWNEYVGLLATSAYDDLSETQRAAHLVFWYESEVQNGGHLQYFENQGVHRVNEVIDALNRLGARSQANVLARAAVEYTAKPRARIKSVKKYVKTALEGRFDSLDEEFHHCKPPLTKALEAFLKANQREFVVVEK